MTYLYYYLCVGSRCIGARYLVDLYGGSGVPQPRDDAVDSLALRFDDEGVLSALDSWLQAFTAEAKSSGLLS